MLGPLPHPDPKDLRYERQVSLGKRRPPDANRRNMRGDAVGISKSSLSESLVALKHATVIALALFGAVVPPAAGGLDRSRREPGVLTQRQPGARPAFSDVTASAGIRFHHHASRTSHKYLIEPMGAGVSFLDFDGDGWLDLFFVNAARLTDPMPAGAQPEKSAPEYWNRLYRNSGDGTFVDVTASAGLKGDGYGMGAAVADFDNDGRADIYVTNVGGNALYRNGGGGTFTDVTERAGVRGEGWSTGAAFLDYDRDGFLDLVVARYLAWNFDNNPWCGSERRKVRDYCHPNAFKSVAHVLYRNLGGGRFADVSEKAGIAARPGKGLGIAIHDYDRDGWPDMAVANDSVGQQLFRNNGNGGFEDVGLKQGVAYNDRGQAFAGMGIDFEDYDNDGLPDLLVNALSLQAYALFRNLEDDFEDVSERTGLSRATMPHSGWGMKFLDCDNDGWKDIFVAQGHVLDTISTDFPAIPYRQTLLLLRNARGRFADVSGRSGDAFEVARAARGAAFGDFNRDGFVDVALNNNDGPAALLRNDGRGHNWVQIETVGTTSNRDGIGALVRVVGDSGVEQFRMVSTASSYLSASDKRVHFGLGQDRRIRTIEIRWPSGVVQTLDGQQPNQMLVVTEPAPTGAARNPAGRSGGR